MVVAPAAISEVVVRSSAPTWYRGPQASPRSELVKPNSMMCARFFHARLAWVIMTPFGRPVVPDVYIRRWTSSPPTADARRPVVEAARRSASVVHPSETVRRDDSTHQRGFDALRRLVREVDERLVAHQRASSGVLEDVAHLRCGQPPVDRHRDRAEVVGGEDRLQELGAVVREESHDVAATDATFGQAAGQRGRALRHLRVGRRLAFEDRDRLVGRAGRVVGEHGEPVHVRLHRAASSCRPRHAHPAEDAVRVTALACSVATPYRRAAYQVVEGERDRPVRSGWSHRA